MQRTIFTTISPNLYELLKYEKERLRKLEQKKCKSQRKCITLYHASESIVRRIKR